MSPSGLPSVKATSRKYQVADNSYQSVKHLELKISFSLGGCIVELKDMEASWVGRLLSTIKTRDSPHEAYWTVIIY